MSINRDITINQLTTQTFYQIPQLFMTRTERKWDAEKKRLITIRYSSPYVKLSSDAKLGYGALLNRCQLSIHSYEQGNKDYVDENGSVFMIFTVRDLMELLDKSKPTVTKIKKELADMGLLREVRQGNNKPNRLYLQNVDATCQIIEHYDEDKTLLKRFDYFGKLLFQKEEFVEETSQTLGTSGGKKFERPKSLPPEVKNFNPSNNNKSNTENNNISSRKTSKNSKEFSSSAGADNITSIEKVEKYIEPQYYSLLQVIADEYNGKFCQQDLFTGEFQNYSLTHKQKMMIGQYLSDGYITSREIINVIERIPYDSESPLAYLLKSLENLREERRLEAKILAHRKAEMAFSE
ncbi:replication initiation protein [Streptococcus dysgalactiae subsp. dysgalactiae]|nr:replication initiation protein [Streptococcus dysgalactiae subsp. dysgalactiae]